jgi:hypothetical protein
VSCCLSSNLRNKSYVFRNEQLTKEEYKEAIAILQLQTYTGQKKAKDEFREIAERAIHKYAHIKNSVNTMGDFIENSKNVYHSYGLVDAENAKYVFYGINTTRDSQDLIGTGRVEECYELTYSGRGANRVVLSLSCGGGSKNIYYCHDCRGCSNCFGCVGLSKKQYCIFNKQYSKEEVVSLRYKWKDMEQKTHTPTMQSDMLPDNIHDVTEAICNEVIECPNQGKIEMQCVSAYRILPDELSFYKQMNLPLPRYCPNCRYHQRLVWKNPFRFYKRSCMCDLPNHDHTGDCPNKFETSYAPDRPEKVYCEKCYQQEVI